MTEPLKLSIEIHCPPEDVFAFVSNFLNDHHWRSEVRGMKFLEDGGPRLGQRTVEDAVVMGQRMFTTTVITEWEQDRRVKVITQDGPAPVIVERICEPVAGGTRMTYIIEVDVSNNTFFRILEPIAAPYYRSKVKGYLKKLKSVLEK